MSKPRQFFAHREARVAYCAFALLTMSSFGPYLLGPVRFEHLLIYPLFLILPLISFTSGGATFPRAPLVIFLLLTATLLWSLISHFSLFGTSELSIAALENYTQPMAVSLIALILVRHRSDETTRAWLLGICKLTVLMFAANAIIATANMIGYLTWIEAYFIRGADQYGNTVWQNSATMGRYPGLFGQPYEAGFGYSIALICSVYIFVRREFGLISAISLGLISVGGALSVSKVFIIIGIPIFFTYLVVAGVLKRKLFLFALLPVATLFILGIIQFSSSWNGFDYFMRLFDPANYRDGSAAATIFANRFSSDESGAAYGFLFVAQQNLLGGLGFLEPDYALDSSFTEAMWRGGLVGLSIHVLIYVTLAYFAIFELRNSKAERRLFLSVLLLTFLSGFGGPTFTVNRVSVPLIVIITIILSLCRARYRQNFFKSRGVLTIA